MNRLMSSKTHSCSWLHQSPESAGETYGAAQDVDPQRANGAETVLRTTVAIISGRERDPNLFIPFALPGRAGRAWNVVCCCVSRHASVASRRVVCAYRVASRYTYASRPYAYACVQHRVVVTHRVASRRTRIGHNPWSAACNSWRWRESNRRGRNCVRPCQREFYAANQVKDRVRQRPLLTVNDRNSVSFLYSWVVFASRSPAHWMTGGSIRAIGGG